MVKHRNPAPSVPNFNRRMAEISKDVQEGSAHCQVLMNAKKMKEAIHTRTEELLKQMEGEVDNGYSVIFDFDESALERCMKFGRVCRTRVLPEKCFATERGTSKATVDEAAYVDVHLCCSDGSNCNDDTPVSITLKHADSGAVNCKGMFVRRVGSKLTYKYYPQEPGSHALHVTVAGQEIPGSPFSVTICMPLKLHFIPRHTILGLRQPYGLAFGPSGQLAVIDHNGYSTVHIYDTALEPVVSFGKWGGGEGQCSSPVGVAFTNEDHLVVVDSGNHRVHKFDQAGNLLQTVGEKGSDALQFLRPTGIGVNSVGHVYVADRSNDRVQILSSDLTYVSSFGNYGDRPGDLHNPWDVAFDSQGYVYVVDAGHTCVKQFTSNGEFRQQIGSANKGGGELKCPQMISIDENDYIYVTDRWSNKISVFDTLGNYHFSFGQYGTGEGQFYEPVGIARSCNGKLCVSESKNMRVQVFH